MTHNDGIVGSTMADQQQQLNALASTNANETTLLKALQTGGAKRKSAKRHRGGSHHGRKHGKSAKHQRGGTGILDIVVPAGLVYANQMYKPKGAAKLYSRSHKLRGSRRHTRNNRSVRKH